MVLYKQTEPVTHSSTRSSYDPFNMPEAWPFGFFCFFGERNKERERERERKRVEREEARKHTQAEQEGLCV